MFGGSKGEVVVYSELDTVEGSINPADIAKIAEKKFDQLIALIKESGWDDVPFTESGHTDIKVLCKVGTGPDGVQCQQAIGKLSAPPKKVFEMAFSTEHSEVKRYDPDTLSIKVVHEVSSDIKIYQSTHSTPFPVTSREFLALRCRKVASDGTCYVWGASINRKDILQLSGHVRGVIAVSGWIIEPVKDDPNSSMVRRVFKVDPKGSIPTMVVNMFKTKAGLQLVAIRKYLKK